MSGSLLYSDQLFDNVTLVRAFDNLPDKIFLAYSEGNKYYFKMMGTSEVRCKDVHKGAILDITVISSGGNTYVVTSS